MLGTVSALITDYLNATACVCMYVHVCVHVCLFWSVCNQYSYTNTCIMQMRLMNLHVGLKSKVLKRYMSVSRNPCLQPVYPSQYLIMGHKVGMLWLKVMTQNARYDRQITNPFSFVNFEYKYLTTNKLVQIADSNITWSTCFSWRRFLAGWQTRRSRSRQRLPIATARLSVSPSVFWIWNEGSMPANGQIWIKRSVSAVYSVYLTHLKAAVTVNWFWLKFCYS